MTPTVRDAVLHEFGAYYLADELPPRLGADEVAAMARDSARRLRWRLEADRLPAAADLLRAMRDDPGHPVVRAIENATQIEWTEDAEQWAELREILGRLADELQRE